MPDLTPAQVLKEPAGPRINAWIAERVMGWKRGQRGNWIVSVPPNHEWLSDDGGWEPTTKEVTFPLEDLHIPAYSTDIAAAWEVVEGIRGPVQHCLLVDLSNCPAGDWQCTIREAVKATDWHERDIARGRAPTAPLAICRAALLIMLEVKATSDV